MEFNTEIANNFTVIITTLLIVKINYSAKGSRRWDLLEWFIAILFGWVSIVLILIEYPRELFSAISNE